MRQETGVRGRRQVQVLREKALWIAESLERGEKRLKGLVEKICGVERLEWCHDVKKLKGLLAALKKILRAEIGG